jgi:hypothetical protein
MIYLDHIAVAGTTLEEATEAVETTLGVALQPGGQHDVFGTHNRLLGLADGLYLEAIAADPSAPTPTRPRWFDLDRFAGPPRLTNWICRTDDIEAALATLPDGVGAPVSLRRGALSWQMAVPADGRLPFDNLHPALIQWGSPVLPGDSLAASGCRLNRLIITHPDALTLAQVLANVFNDDRVVFERGAQPALHAEFETPHGVRTLE